MSTQADFINISSIYNDINRLNEEDKKKPGVTLSLSKRWLLLVSWCCWIPTPFQLIYKVLNGPPKKRKISWKQ